jgi:uncharacterized membrane protein
VELSQWLIALHVTGAFLLLGGGVLAAVLSVAAQRSERPSEIALFLGLTRVAVVAIGIGALLTLVLGLWLVSDADYSFGEAWIILSLVLWLGSMGAGGAGGARDKETRLLAQKLATEANEMTPELRARLRDPLALALSYGSGLALVVVLALMVWKPGS